MEAIFSQYTSTKLEEVRLWYKAASIDDVPSNGGACVKYKGLQIAIFNFSRTNSWYACQNICPHKMEMVLSRGMTGDENGIPKIACPLHKKTFSLLDGDNLNGDLSPIAIFPVKIEDRFIYIGFKD